MEFVDPQKYHIPTPTPTISPIKPPTVVHVSDKMVEYATATVDRPDRVLATEIYHVPFPYWDLTAKVTPTGEYPEFMMEIRDSKDPNRVIKTIKFSQDEILRASRGSRAIEETVTIREGYGDYYFAIHSESLKSLTLTIKIPEKYLI